MRTGAMSRGWEGYALAVAVTALAALVRWTLPGVLEPTPFLAFYPAVVAAAAFGGFGPGLLATVGSALCVALLFGSTPGWVAIGNPVVLGRLAIFLAGGAGIGVVSGMRRVARAHELKQAEELTRAGAETERQKELLTVTLASIGDAVIVTDIQGRVTFLNGEAERLTGWTSQDAVGQPLNTVFRIINEDTRQTVESPVEKVLRQGTVVGLANHTLLIARDGRETPIDDSGAPIRHRDGAIQGVVLVFRDFSTRRAAETALRESEQRVRRKLESLLSPKGDIGTLALADIVDVAAIQSLMDDWYKLTRFPMSIIDLEGKMLVGVGWQPICTDFHRVHPEMCRHCVDSDLHLAEGISPGEFRLYKCKNNMWDIATPILVGGRHVGNLFSGQFFFEDEPLDRELFRSQARQYGLDEEKYLAALEAVPRLTRESVEAGMAFLVKLAHTLSLLSYSNIKLARSTELLGKSETLLRTLIDGAPDPVFIKDLDSRMLMANPATLEVFGKPAEEVLGKTSREYFDDPSLAQAVIENDQRVMESGYTQVVEETVSTSQGRRVFLSTKSPWRDAQGRILGIIGMTRDITERKQAEKERETAVRFLHLVNEAQGIKHLVRTAATFFQQHSGCQAVGIRLREGNDYPYYETRGFPPDFVLLENRLCTPEAEGTVVRDSTGNPVLECMCGNVICGRFDPSKPFFTAQGSFWTNCTTDLLASTTEADRQARTRNRCNGEGYESVALIPLRVGEQRLGLLQLNDRRKGRFSPQTIAVWERLAGQLAVALARSQAEEERERLLAELARSNAELEQFASLISHDLLTPIVTTSSYASLLASDRGNQLSTRSHEALQLVQEGVARMNQLIRRLLDYSRLGKGGLKVSACDLELVLEAVTRSLESSLAETGVQVTHDPLPTVQADPALLSQVFQNLLENAIKYRGTEAPRIHVAVRQAGAEWVFSVVDNGIGIDPAHIPRLFQMFQRLHRDESRYTGLGVGLAACKRIIEKHGGRIWVESQPGQGSTFSFTLAR